jgi:hypothetical protein
MKVYIGKYKSWFGPYQLADLLCFWAKDEVDEYGIKGKPQFVHSFGEWLAHGKVSHTAAIYRLNEERHNTILYRFLLWLSKQYNRKIKVKIHDYDVWGMDETLALVILPMLKKLQETKSGAPS